MHEVQSQCMEKHPNTFFLWNSQYILKFTDQILHVEQSLQSSSVQIYNVMTDKLAEIYI